MSYLPHLQTKCHHSGAGITKKPKKVLSVPLFFHSVLPPGTELLSFCTCLLLPIFLILAVLVQIFTPATDFCPFLLQHWRITENSKIQGSHFWHCYICVERLKSQVSLGHIPVSCSQVQYPSGAEFLYTSHSLCWSLSNYIHYFSCLNPYKGITDFTLIHLGQYGLVFTSAL